MPVSPTAIRIGISAGWLIAATALLRFWDVTLRIEGFPLWTALFIALYAAAMGLLRWRGSHDGDRPWSDVWLWLGIMVLLTAGPALFPILTLGDTTLQSVSLLRVFDIIIPLWILIRGVYAAWHSRRPALAALAVPVYLLAVFYVLSVRMPGTSHVAELDPLTAEETATRAELERHVRVLADSIGVRGAARYQAAVATADYLRGVLEALGYRVEEQRYTLGDREHRNLQVEIPGSGAVAREIVLVGAHYDSEDRTPGADDNATGVAGVLELARLLRGATPARTIRLVLFGTEEPPYFNTDAMGSRVYAARAAAAGDPIVAMYSLEMLGYFSDEPGSQGYPPPLHLFYPDRGDFLAFVGNPASGRLLRRALRTFRGTTRFPSEGMVAPALVPGVELSDHASFWRHGFPAISISDTGPFRNRQYHTAADTTGALDFERMARAVVGIRRVVEAEAGGA